MNIYSNLSGEAIAYEVVTIDDFCVTDSTMTAFLGVLADIRVKYKVTGWGLVNIASGLFDLLQALQWTAFLTPYLCWLYVQLVEPQGSKIAQNQYMHGSEISARCEPEPVSHKFHVSMTAAVRIPPVPGKLYQSQSCVRNWSAGTSHTNSDFETLGRICARSAVLKEYRELWTTIQAR